MSEFSPRSGAILPRIARALVSPGRFNTGVTSLALVLGGTGCAAPVSAPGSNEGAQPQGGRSAIMWKQEWSGTYRNTETGEAMVIPYGNVVEVEPPEDTCPQSFTVISGSPAWELVPGTCTNYTEIQVEVALP